MKKSLSILLIEDNFALARQVVDFLEGLQWRVDFAAEGKLGEILALQNNYDVVILDLNLPDCDGIDVCQYIKKNARKVVPILILTARDEFEDKVKGFRSGADDYLTKPFDLREVALRCEVLARRPTLHNETIISCGDLKLDNRTLRVEWKESNVQVTKIGFEILRKLALEFPYPVTKSELITHLWGDSPPESNALKSHIYTLRRSIEKVSQNQVLQTISNIGYQLKVPCFEE